MHSHQQISCAQQTMLKFVLLVALLAPLVLAQCDPLCCRSFGGDCIPSVSTCGGVCVGECGSTTNPASCECPSYCVTGPANRGCVTYTCEDDGSCTETYAPAGTNCDDDFCTGFRCDGAGTCVVQDPCPSQFACEEFLCFETDQSCQDQVGDGLLNDEFCQEKYSNDPCVSVTCNPTDEANRDEDGCVVRNVQDGTPCDDGLFCTVGDTCQSGTCSRGSFRSCDDGVLCTLDSCDEQGDVCRNEPLNSRCTPSGPCVEGGCSPSDPRADFNGCAFTLKPAGEICVAAPPGSCFQDAVCNADGDCGDYLPLADGTGCDDGSACTLNDVCTGGQCSGDAVPCTSSPYTCATNECNPATGQCDQTYDDSVCDYLDSQCSAGVCLTADVNNLDDETGCQIVSQNEAGSCTGCPIPAGGDAQCYTCTCSEGQCIAVAKNPGTQCDDGVACTTADECNAAGECVGTPTDSFCDNRIPAANDCERSRCQPDNAGANSDGCLSSPKPATVVCRSAAGVCDAAENCDGTSLQCPPDAKLDRFDPPCRPATGLCDLTEVCDGSSNDCPPDEVFYSGITCGPGSGDVCDPDERCDGVNKDCPADVFKPADFVCRQGSGDSCDEDETCPGTPGGACPQDDAPSNAGVTCREGQGTPNGGSECDQEERCTGVPGERCPEDLCRAGEVCRASIGQCDVAESCPSFDCSANGLVCPPNSFKAQGTPCDERDNNTCTIGQCDGAGGCETIVLPDHTDCTTDCGAGSCQDGVCLCPCEVECVLSRGAVQRNSPSAKGKDREDPVWETDLFQNTQLCDLSLDEWFNAKKNDLPDGCENDLLAQYYTVRYNEERYKLSTGAQCFGVAGDDNVQAVMDYVDALLPLSALSCQTLDVPQCGAKLDVLSSYNEGTSSVDQCSSSLPVDVAGASQTTGASSDTPVDSESHDDGLSGGAIAGIVIGSVVALGVLILIAWVALSAQGRSPLQYVSTEMQSIDNSAGVRL